MKGWNKMKVSIKLKEIENYRGNISKSKLINLIHGIRGE